MVSFLVFKNNETIAAVMVPIDQAPKIPCKM